MVGGLVNIGALRRNPDRPASCWAKGRRQAEVLPVPTARMMATPVYKPRSGSASQEGRGEAEGEAGEGEGGEGRCREVPGMERRVGVRIFEGDEVKDRNVAFLGERTVAEREVERSEGCGDGDDEACGPGPRGTPRGPDCGCCHHSENAFPQGSIAP